MKFLSLFSVLFGFSVAYLEVVIAFAPCGRLCSTRAAHLAATEELESSSQSFLDTLQVNLRDRWTISQEALREGYDLKQVLAMVIAGDYNQSEAVARLQQEIDTSRTDGCVVMFTWENSPSCQKAVAALNKANANLKIVRLDDPWSEGNPLRAELGKLVGRSSVPAIFIGGDYVGGFDGGVSDESPGIVDLAFRGTLRTKLEASGALKV